MIKIKDRTFIPIFCTHGELSGKQNGESCLVIPNDNLNASIMFVQAGVPVTNMQISTPGESYSKDIYLYLVASDSTLRIFSDVTSEDYYVFTENFTFYCDVKIAVES